MNSVDARMQTLAKYWREKALTRSPEREIATLERCALDLEGAMAAERASAQPAPGMREALELALGALAYGSTIDQRYETYKIVKAALEERKHGS